MVVVGSRLPRYFVQMDSRLNALCPPFPLFRFEGSLYTIDASLKQVKTVVAVVGDAADVSGFKRIPANIKLASRKFRSKHVPNLNNRTMILSLPLL